MKLKYPLFTLSHVFWLLGAVCVSLLFIIGGNAKSNDYTDKMVEAESRAQDTKVDLKIAALKESIDSIKYTSLKTEEAQNEIKKDVKEIYKVIVTRK